MFDAFAAHRKLAIDIAALNVWKCGHVATADELNGTAEYLKQLGKLLADHTESVMADCAASISFGAIAEQDARVIEECFSDCAGQLHEAAYRVQEAA